MLERRRQKCGNCDSFVEVGNSEAPNRIGNCCHNPPIAMPIHMQAPGSMLNPSGPQMTQGLQGIWPPTRANMWCKQWCMKTEGEP
jgi:hypothetical protein